MTLSYIQTNIYLRLHRVRACASSERSTFSPNALLITKNEHKSFPFSAAIHARVVTHLLQHNLWQIILIRLPTTPCLFLSLPTIRYFQSMTNNSLTQPRYKSPRSDLRGVDKCYADRRWQDEEARGDRKRRQVWQEWKFYLNFSAFRR